MSNLRASSALSTFSCLSLCLAAVGCGAINNGSDTSSVSDASTGEESASTTTGGAAATIYDIQMGLEAGTVFEGDAVTVSDVVVTSPIISKESGDTFYVSETAGGAWSGIAVFMAGGLGSEHADLAVGDVVTIIANVSEFYDQSQLALGSSSDLVVSASGQPLTGTVVSAADVATGGAMAEDYESVLVRVENVSCTAEEDMYGQFQVTDGLLVDDDFLVAADLPGVEPSVGQAFDSIQGVMLYSFEEFKLAPRDLADVVGPGGDGDGDGDGDTTTGDGDATIYEVQMGMYGVGSTITLTDVIVSTPTDPDGEAFYVQESGGGEYSGISVFVQDPTGLSVAPGDVVTLTGEYAEYFELSQIILSTGADLSVTASGAAPTPEVVAAADVATGGGLAENYEGVLVTVENVMVTDDSIGFGDFLVTDGLRVDDYFFPMGDFTVPAVGTAYTSISGVMSYAFDDFRLTPRDAADLVAQ